MLEDLGKKISDIRQNVKSGANSVLDNTKQGMNNISKTIELKRKIDSSKKEISGAYKAVGEKFFSENSEAAPGGYEEEFEKIAELKGVIAESEETLRNLTGVIVCPGCGAEVKKEYTFCTICGYKVKGEAQEEEASTCPTCGKNIPDGSVFCIHCGAKI